MRLQDSLWFNFFITYTAYCVLYITRKNLTLTKILIQDNLQLSTSYLGYMDTAFLSAYALFQILLPPLSDIYGVRKFIISSYTIAGIVCIIFSFVSHPNLLIVLWFLEGIAHSSIFPIFVKLLAIHLKNNILIKDSNDNVKFLGWWTTSQQLGGILATFVVTYFTNETKVDGWRSSFLASGIITLLMALFLYYLLQEPLYQNDLKYSSQTSCVTEIHSIPNNDSSLQQISSMDIELSQNFPSNRSREDSSDDLQKRRKPFETYNYISTKDSTNANFLLPKMTCSTLHTSIEMKKIDIPTKCHSLKNPSTFHTTYSQPERHFSFLYIFTLKGVLSCSLAYFCVKFVRYALIHWLPFFFSTQWNVTAKRAAFSGAIFELGGFFGCLLIGSIVKRCFHGQRLKATYVLCLASSCILLLFTAAHYQFIEKQSYLKNTTTFSNIQEYGKQNNMFLLQHREFIQSILLLCVGLTLAGPDSLLGATSSMYLCDNAGTPSALSAMTGIINGIGALGTVAQSYVLPVFGQIIGWTAVFIGLAITCLLASVALLMQPLA
jgi:sugar phosphate permease